MCRSIDSDYLWNPKLSTLNNAPVLQYQYQGKLVTWKQQGYIGYVVALDFDDGCAGYMELYEDGDLSGKYVLVDLSCLELYHGSN